MIDQLVAAIKEKKELAALDDAFVRERVEKMLRSDARIARKLEESRDFDQFKRSKEYKAILKQVRAELRAVYGVFHSGEREAILAQISACEDPARKKMLVGELLETHTSTKERLIYYPRVYKELAARIPEPRTILDLGCGMGPLSAQYSPWRARWIASDISSQDLAFLDEAFAVLGIEGETRQLDLINDHPRLQDIDADVTFLFKLLDTLEEQRRHISYAIFDHIHSPWIVVSFPTTSLGGGKRIAKAGRTWFERMLTRKELGWETFEVPNELFYVISRKK